MGNLNGFLLRKEGVRAGCQKFAVFAGGVSAGQLLGHPVRNLGNLRDNGIQLF